MKSSRTNGFTLIEVLLVIALIAILAGITIVAINPARQYGNANNTERLAHVNTILNAVHQYVVDHDGQIPDTIPEGTICSQSHLYSICVTGQVCNGADLSVLTDSETYLTALPLNPRYSTETDTGYNIIRSSNGRITVCAMYTDLEASISVTR